MPFKSAKQRRAMYAAASGKGKVGISKKTAKKFIKHSKGKRPTSGRKRVKKSQTSNSPRRKTPRRSKK